MPEHVRRLAAERLVLIASLRRGVAHSRKLGHTLGWASREACAIAGIDDPGTVAGRRPPAKPALARSGRSGA